MGAAIGQALPLAVGVALSPVPIIAVVLMLMSQRARLNGTGFVLGWLAGLGVATPVVTYFALGDRSRRVLAGLRDWMGQYNAVIMAVLCLVIGAKLIGDAITGFSM
jgi:hypothetical protein